MKLWIGARDRARPRRVGALFAAVLLAAGPGAPAAEAQDRPERRAEVAGRGWLGISYTAPVEGRTAAGGPVVLQRVLPGSPAERAGLQRGDTIVRWNQRADVTRALAEAQLQPGDTVRVRVRRGGLRDRDLAVVVGRRPRTVAVRPEGARSLEVVRPGGGEEHVIVIDGDTVVRLSMDSLAVRADSLHRRLRIMLRDSLGPHLRELEQVRLPELRIDLEEVERSAREMEREVRAMRPGRLALDLELGARSVAGAEFAEINAGLSGYFGVDHGVVVLRVAPATPAARAGLLAGDVVVRANGESVDDVRDLRRAVSRTRDRAVELEVVRKGERRTLEMAWD